MTGHIAAHRPLLDTHMPYDYCSAYVHAFVPPYAQGCALS